MSSQSSVSQTCLTPSMCSSGTSNTQASPSSDSCWEEKARWTQTTQDKTDWENDAQREDRNRGGGGRRHARENGER